MRMGRALFLTPASRDPHIETFRYLARNSAKSPVRKMDADVTGGRLDGKP